MNNFLLPDLGEGLPDAEIVEWHVKEGDDVEKDQPLVSMETAKAVVEVPSPEKGKIEKLHGAAGDIIATGSPLVGFEGEGVAPKRKDTGTVAGKIIQGDTVIKQKASSVGGVKVLPAVRALATKLKVDLSSITPTGPNATITKQDVENSAKNGSSSSSLNQSSPIKDGYEPLRGVRRSMCQSMRQSLVEVVPVSIFDDVDVHQWKAKDYTSRIIQAIIYACSKEPALNAWFDGQNMARKLIKDVNLGLAVDTSDGLFVPVISAAQNLGKDKIRSEINTLKAGVEKRSLPPKQLQGASIVLSNFGKFAGRYATPIIVPPSVSIIAVGSLRDEVRAVDGAPKVVSLLPLSLTFDHRAVTGGEATRFLGYLIQSLSKSSI
jgi:2-oxoisovalerate dehydrogenase E2 component (dihydrolipoyl transacylase)